MKNNIYAFILSVAVIIGLLSVTPSTVSAATGSGSISGTVTAGATPIQGVEVYAYQTATGDSSPAATTDAFGNYLLTGLSPGSYKVFSYSYWLGYSNQWYDNTTDFSAAGLVVVTAGNTAININASLTAGSEISGTVNDAAGIGIPNLSIYVYDAVDTYTCYSLTRTDADGKYTTRGVPTGSVKIIFGNYGTDDYTSIWYNNKAEWATATPIGISAPHAMQDINAVLGKGGGISGKITDASGSPIPDTYVMVYDADGNCSTINSCNTSVQTDAAGNYSYKGLRTGTYKIEFSNWPIYSNGLYRNAFNLNTATIVSVTAPDTTTSINAILFQRGASNCTAKLEQRDSVYYLNVPVIKYENSGTATFYNAELKLVPSSNNGVMFRITSNTGLITDTLPYSNCQPSTLSLSGSSYTLHLTNIDLNGSYYWADLNYLENVFFLLTDFGTR